MSDISKCQDTGCSSRELCYRYTAPVSERWQSYGSFNREQDAYNCDMFWSNGVCKYCHKENGNHRMSCPIMKIQVNL